MTGREPTILVVEDDEETLNVLARTLASGGYDVLWARNGEDTLKVLTRHDGRIDAIVLDVVLPGMTATELVEKVSHQHPETAAIYVSAHDRETVREHGIDPDTMPFLPKPYEPEALLTMVEEALRPGITDGD